MRALIGLALASVLTLLCAVTVSAQGTKAGVVTTLEGIVTARRVAVPAGVPLKFKDDVFLQDTVTTGDKALARMLLGGKAVVTVRERSTLTITEVPGRSTIELETGKFALAVARERMRPGEEIHIRTPNAVAAVRGTVVITEVARQGAQLGGPLPAVTSFFVLRGAITAQPVDPATRQPLGAALPVGRMQAYSGAGTAAPRVTPIPPEQVGQITAGLQPAGPKGGSDAGTQQVKEQAMSAAVQLLAFAGGAVQASAPAVSTAGAPVETTPGAPLIPPVGDTLATFAGPAAAPVTESSAPPASTEPPPPTPVASSPPPPSQEPSSGSPGVVVTGPVALGAGQTLATFDTTTTRTATSPAIAVTGSAASVTKSAADGVVQVTSTGALSLASPLLSVDGGAGVGTANPGLSSVLATVGAGTDPLTVAITPNGQRLYVVNAEGGTVRVFDTTTNGLIATITVGDSPRGIAITPDGATAYVTRQGAISIISTATNAVTGTVSGGGFGPFGAVRGITITPDGAKGYFAFDDEGDQVQVFDVATNTVTATVTGPFNDGQRLTVSPDGSRVYVSDQGGGNKVHVISTATNTVIASVSVGMDPFGLAISRDGTRLYVANTTSGTVSVINTGSNTVEKTISVAQPFGLALTPDGTRLIVTNGNTNTVTVISTATDSVLTTITVGAAPVDVAVTADGTRAYVVRNEVSGTFVVVDVSFGAPLITVAPGGSITSTSTAPLVQFVSSTVAVGAELVRLSGRSSATADEIVDDMTLTLGTDQPVKTAGPLVELVGGTASAQKAVVVDTALLEATAPLLNITAASAFSTGAHAIDLLARVKLTSVGPLVKLDASTLAVAAGALVRAGGGSLLRVTGDLVQLGNGATLTLANGPLLIASGGSVVNVSGGLIGFGGTGGNTVNVTNALCSGTCPTFGGIPVFLAGGAVSSQVSIGPNAIKNPSLGSVTTSGSSTALIVVDGPASKVTIAAP